MKNQFMFKRKETTPSKEEGGEPTETIYYDTFNVEKVIRTYSLPTGGAVVLIADGHEISEESPVRNPKTGKIEYKRERVYRQSQLTIDEEEAQRFRNLFSV